MKAIFQNKGTAVTLSVFSLLLFLERILLDLRYVSLEFEARDAVMPFTAPYMVILFFLFGFWIKALLSGVQGKRAAFLTLSGFHLLNLAFAMATAAVLCPSPCSTAAPITDILTWGTIPVSLAAAGSVLTVFFSQTLQHIKEGEPANAG